MDRNYFEKVHWNKITSKSEFIYFIYQNLFNAKCQMSKQQRFFGLSKTNQNHHLQSASVFHQNCMKKYIKTTTIFFVHRNYVEKSTSKWHGFLQSTLKWRGNLSIFSLRHIDVISPSNQGGFDVVCLLGISLVTRIYIWIITKTWFDIFLF